MTCNRCRATGCDIGCRCGRCVCACLEGALLTPMNRPGLQQLHVRLGDYRDFLLNAILALSRSRETDDNVQA